jgi:hypothetical protein
MRYPFNAEVCPNCGKQFDSVQCPVCRYTDKPMYFMSGCPKCGYLSPRTQLGRKGIDGDTSRSKPRKKRNQQDIFLAPSDHRRTGTTGLSGLQLLEPMKKNDLYRRLLIFLILLCSSWAAAQEEGQTDGLAPGLPGYSSG